MKRLLALVSFLFLYTFAAPSVLGQATQISSGPVNPPTCQSTRGLQFYNTTTKTMMWCGPTDNVWTSFSAGGPTIPNSNVSFTATPAFDGSANNSYTMTITGNVTSSTITGTPQNGNLMAFTLCQDGTGGRTFAFPPNFTIPSGFTFDTAPNHCNYLTFKYDGSNWTLLSNSGGSAASSAPVGAVGDLQAKLDSANFQATGINQPTPGAQTQLVTYGFTTVESPLFNNFNWNLFFGNVCNVTAPGVLQPSAVGAGSGCYYLYSGRQWPHNQYSEITILTGSGNCGFALYLDGTGYGMDTAVSGGMPHLSTFNVRVNNVAIDSFTATANVGDVWRLQIDGNVITAYQNGTLRHTTIDTANSNYSGAPGFNINNGNGVVFTQISRWSGGGVADAINVNNGYTFNSSLQGNVALKPTISPDAIQYVNSTGNDANDGLSWGTAKKTIYAALIGLPGGAQSPAQAGSGTVYVSSGFWTPYQNNNGVVNGGLWLMGSHDPSFATPPPGWLRVTNNAGQGINIIGVASNQGTPNPHKASVSISKGTGSFAGDPAIWISGVTEPIYIANLNGGGGARFMLLGQCFNGDRTGTCAVNSEVFENVSGAGNFNSGSGPCTDITGTSYWLWFRDYGCAGNAVNAAGGYSSNQAAAFLLDGTGNGGNGLVTIRDSNLSSGGIKVIPGSGSNGQLFVENVTQEGDFVHTMPPVVWLTNWAGPNNAVISNVICADCGAPGPLGTVQIDPPSSLVAAPAAVVINSQVQGPAYVINSPLGGTNATGVSPLRLGQVGFSGSSITGQTDAARRNDVLATARFANLAPSDPSTWGNQDPGNTTVTLGVTDPFGGTRAAQFAHNIAGGTGVIIPSPGISYTPANGDWIIIGIWEMGLGGDTNFFLSPTGFSASNIYQDNSSLVNDTWTWRWKAYKMNAGGAFTVVSQPQYSNSLHPVFYGPVLYIIPSGTISDNEAVAFATSMATTDITCPVGSTCNVPGHPLQFDALSVGSPATPVLKNPLVSKAFIPFAICNNATPGTSLSLPTANAATPACNTGTNIQEGTLNFDDGQSAQFTYLIPSDWSGAIDARLIFFHASTSGTVIFQIATSCAATSGSSIDDLAFNTADAFATITLNATANAQWQTAKTGINITGCSAGNTLQLKISRTTDTAGVGARVKGLELTVRRTL